MVGAVFDLLLPNLFSGETKPVCANDASTWCGQVWNVTHVSWLAESAGWLVAKPLHILGIVVVAIITRILLHRRIRRLTTPNCKCRMATILLPLRERAPHTLASIVSVPAPLVSG